MKIDYIKGSDNNPVLSILICTLEERNVEFLSRILSILEKQIKDKDVELVILTDNAEMRIGAKRNLALDSANGKYICFIDDDDIVSDDYIDSILEKTKEDSDVIVFNGFVTTNGEDIKYAKQGIEYQHGEIDGVYYRLPNHLSVHKKETIKERFLDVRTGEDDEWAKRRLSEIKTQSRIDKNLYHYDFRTTTKKYFLDEDNSKKLEIINTILDIKIERPSNPSNLEGSIYINVPHLAGMDRFYNFPLYFSVLDIFDRVVWNSQLNIGYFSMWPWLTWTKVKIVDSSGNLIYKWTWNPLKDGCVCHQIFYLWSLKNRGSFGIAIGTHDGTFGEWVGLVNDGLLKALLIEASEKQFLKLNEFYSGKEWVKCENKLVTVNGGDVIFYEGGSGHTNSVSKDHIEITVKDNIKEVKKDSESFISILERNKGYKWVHIDVEGIDDDLILSLRGREDLLPEVLIYEHESLTIEKESKLVKFLENNSYTIHKGESRNTIAIK